MTRPYTLRELQATISPIAKRHGVGKVAVFGSYGRRQATERSDIDLHIADSGKVKTLLQLIAFQQDVEEALKLHVDVVTNGILDKRFLEEIGRDEVVLYEQ